jgi:hypothetical protein
MERTTRRRGQIFTGLLRRQMNRLETRIRGERELLWHPRLELAAAREMAASQRRLGQLRALARLHGLMRPSRA